MAISQIRGDSFGVPLFGDIAALDGEEVPDLRPGVWGAFSESRPKRSRVGVEARPVISAADIPATPQVTENDERRP